MSRKLVGSIGFAAVLALFVWVSIGGTPKSILENYNRFVTGGFDPLVAVLNFVLILVVAAAYSRVRFEKTEELVRTVREQPIDSVSYGLVVLVAMGAVVLLLVDAAPSSVLWLIFAWALVWFVILATVVGWLVAGTVLFDYAGRERDGFLRPALVGATLAGLFAAVPLLGLLPRLAVTVVGVGSLVTRRWGDVNL